MADTDDDTDSFLQCIVFDSSFCSDTTPTPQLILILVLAADTDEDNKTYFYNDGH